MSRFAKLLPLASVLLGNAEAYGRVQWFSDDKCETKATSLHVDTIQMPHHKDCYDAGYPGADASFRPVICDFEQIAVLDWYTGHGCDPNKEGGRQVVAANRCWKIHEPNDDNIHIKVDCAPHVGVGAAVALAFSCLTLISTCFMGFWARGRFAATSAGKAKPVKKKAPAAPAPQPQVQQVQMMQQPVMQQPVMQQPVMMQPQAAMQPQMVPMATAPAGAQPMVMMQMGADGQLRPVAQ